MAEVGGTGASTRPLSLSEGCVWVWVISLAVGL